MQVKTFITLRTGKPGAYENHPPGSTVSLTEDEARSLIDRGSAAAVHEPAIHAPDLLDAIVDAVDDLPKEAFGKDGKPSTKSIEDIIGRRVSASERDKAWEIYRGLIGDGQ